jgi:hypothetical protein
MCKIVSLKHTMNGFYQIRLQEVVIFPEKSSPLAALNESNPKFTPNKPHNAWLTVQLADLKKYFPQLNLEKAEELERGEEMPLNWENPEIAGNALHLQIEEYLLDEGNEKENEYNQENMPKVAKQIELSFKLAENGRRYNRTKGREGLKVGNYILDHIDEMVTDDHSDIGYFTTDALEPIFRRVKVVYGKPKHTLIEDQILVHYSELAWAEKIDITSRNNEEVEEKEPTEEERQAAKD